MRVQDDGNVGIGTQTPTAKLTIRSAYDQLELQDSDSGNGWWLGTGNDADLYFATASGSAQTRVYFKADGNVGIGTGSPDYKLQVDGDIVPESDNTDGLGTSALRWANLYVADAHYSNVGTGGNDVDGTEGSWTIQEGEDDLFLLNRKNGKKYKFKLEAV